MRSFLQLPSLDVRLLNGRRVARLETRRNCPRVEATPWVRKARRIFTQVRECAAWSRRLQADFDEVENGSSMTDDEKKDVIQTLRASFRPSERSNGRAAEAP